MSLRAAIRYSLGGFFLLALSLGSPASAQQIVVSNLVSDQSGVAASQDISLINPMGFARGTGTNWMVATRGSGLGLTYDGFGDVISAFNVTIPPASGAGTGQPTAVVFNGTTSFNSPDGSGPAQFIFATADGSIQAYNPNSGTNPFTAVIAVNNSSTSSYTGITIAEVSPNVFYLFAANFKTGAVDVFDGNFHPVADVALSAADVDMSSSLSGVTLVPYNIQTVGRDLVLTLAGRGSNGQLVTGANLGVVQIRNAAKGNNVLRTIHGSFLNAPYGIAQAPADFGRLSHLLLIGNSGNGTIAAFDPFGGKSGAVFLLIDSATGATLTIDGLKALGFGAMGAAGDPSFLNQQSGAFNALHFTAGPSAGTHGLFGNIVPVLADFVLGEQ